MIPACPSLISFFNRSKVEWTNSSKKLCLCMFCINLCQGWFCGFWGLCGLMTCLQSGQRQTEICFQPLCNPLWLAPLKLLTNLYRCHVGFDEQFPEKILENTSAENLLITLFQRNNGQIILLKYPMKLIYANATKHS